MKGGGGRRGEREEGRGGERRGAGGPKWVGLEQKSTIGFEIEWKVNSNFCYHLVYV